MLPDWVYTLPGWFSIIFGVCWLIGFYVVGPMMDKPVTPTAQAWPSGQMERDFQSLLTWERDGIFPRIMGGTRGPDWYEDEKLRRGIVVTPGPEVSWQQFNDPQYRQQRGR